MQRHHFTFQIKSVGGEGMLVTPMRRVECGVLIALTLLPLLVLD